MHHITGVRKLGEALADGGVLTVMLLSLVAGTPAVRCLISRSASSTDSVIILLERLRSDAIHDGMGCAVRFASVQKKFCSNVYEEVLVRWRFGGLSRTQHSCDIAGDVVQVIIRCYRCGKVGGLKVAGFL